jgi:hypothetical protein
MHRSGLMHTCAKISRMRDYGCLAANLPILQLKKARACLFWISLLHARAMHLQMSPWTLRPAAVLTFDILCDPMCLCLQHVSVFTQVMRFSKQQVEVLLGLCVGLWTEEDVLALFEQIEELNANVAAPEQVVLSPFFIVAGPDYARMRALGCPARSSCEYAELWWHNSSGGLAQHPYSRGDLRSVYRHGFEAGLWHPEYHGRSHFDARAWAAYLCEGDDATTAYFEAGLTYYGYGKRRTSTGGFQSTHSEYLADDGEFQRDLDEMHAWVRDGVGSFAAFWGYMPSVTACPCHYAMREHGHVLAEYGVQAVQGERSGRGLLHGLHHVIRTMYDVWVKRKDEWVDQEEALWNDVDKELLQGHDVALQV